MRYLVAGGAGFLGSHFVDRVLAEGHEVVIIDNLSSGLARNVPEAARKLVVPTDISNLSNIYWNPFDYVINFACLASPVWYYKYPLETLRANSTGVENLIRIAQKSKARFLQTSTSEIYGDPEVHPQNEKYAGKVFPYSERSCYDEGKRYAEALIFAYQRQGLNAGIARIFNTYGPRMRADDGRVVSSFLYQALTSQPITIQGDGSQTRSFCYVDDMIDGLWRLLHSDIKEPVNLGNPNEVTVKELAEKISLLHTGETRVEYHNRPLNDPSRRQPDIAWAKKLLGWEPTIDLTTGLIRTYDWMKTTLTTSENKRLIKPTRK